LRLLEDAVWVDAPHPPLVLRTEDATPILASAPVGTELEPELGATIVRVVEDGFPRLAVVLEGPGVDGRHETSIPLTRPELAARDRACANYPLGIDLVFVETDGRVAALPRTTRVRSLEG
jgi:alpha-D-ribose 1-methylphosphonate 5-triphosphate synthase subunit PhnH